MLQPRGELPAPRAGHVSAHVGSQLVVFGGVDKLERKLFDDIHVLDLGECRADDYLFDLIILGKSEHPPQERRRRYSCCLNCLLHNFPVVRGMCGGIRAVEVHL